MVWSTSQLSERCERLGALLQAHEALWRPRAFHWLHLPWEAELPALSRALRALSLEQAEALACDNDALVRWLSPWLPVALELAGLCGASPHPVADRAPSLPEPRDVPGRKWQQIRAFVDALPERGLPALEWCAGKAHLGRHYAAVGGAPVAALEKNEALVDSGNLLGRKARLPVQLHRVDVLSPAAVDFIEPQRQVLALHACGDLYLRLLHACTERPPLALALAPCCYHLTRAARYRPLSAVGRRYDLDLGVEDLHTAVQESVTSPARVQRQRRRLQAWRLGFDHLQRELRGVDAYLHTPSRPLSVLHGGFAQFCRELAAHKGLALPGAIDLSRFEALGEQRLREVAALDLVRLLFRRPLESWLVLDSACHLAGLGYDVTVGTFCPRALTPRNLLIHARRP